MRCPFPGPFIGGADPVPYHVGDHGHAVVFDNDHLHAIFQGEGGGVEDRGLGFRHAGQDKEDGEKYFLE